MSKLIASDSDFQSTLDYAKLPPPKLLALFHATREAYNSFYWLWQGALQAHCGREETAALTTRLYPVSADGKTELEAAFYADLNFIWRVIPRAPQLLTFASYHPALLPEQLDNTLDLHSLSGVALQLLWNTATLAYVMQTNRWVDTLSKVYDQATALKLEKEVWVERGGAEEDLRYGLKAAGQQQGNVETLLRGFQMAPGEVGLVDAQFELNNPNHGWITHRRCPAHDRFRDSDKARLENSCVICVIAMRLSGEMVNKSIRCRAASLPPHRGDSDHACRWEYWLEE